MRTDHKTLDFSGKWLGSCGFRAKWFAQGQQLIALGEPVDIDLIQQGEGLLMVAGLLMDDGIGHMQCSEDGMRCSFVP